MTKKLIGLAMAAIGSAGLVTAGVVRSDAQPTACADGIGRYQLSTSATSTGRDDVYETVFDTCTGKIVSRTETSVGKYD